MLFLDTLRGMDSTGVFGVDHLANVEIHKEASHGLDFIQTAQFKEFKGHLLNRGLFAVGHNRAATKGEISDKNAHPFYINDKIILVQNGTYKGDHKKHKDVEVDTEAVAHVIEENEDIETALKKIDASYALCWFNTTTKTLHLIRNDERPMWTLRTKYGGLMWASEPNFIYMAANRNNISYDEKAQQLTPHTLLTLKIDGKNWKSSEQKLDCKFSWQSQKDWPFQGRRVSNDEVGEAFRLEPPAVGRMRHRFSPANQVDELLLHKIVAERPEYHLERATALRVAEACHNLKTKPILVELLDYLPANKNPDCTTWHVFGNVSTPEEGEVDKAVAHWIVKDKSENEITNYVASTFYMARPNTVKSDLAAENSCVVCMFMTEPTPITTQVTTTQ